MDSIYIGCAGWSIPKALGPQFPGAGTHLERVSRVLTCAEINTTFYRSHRASTYERWRDSVPETFRFSVKLRKEITHQQRLEGVHDLLKRFLDEVSVLDRKLGGLLIQLPPSLVLAERNAEEFFSQLRRLTDLPAVCEPRHTSWFSETAENILNEFRIARAAVDPALAPGSERPGGWRGLSYFRWHGSPRMYYSAYDDQQLAGLADLLRLEPLAGHTAWCIFDNTASGAAAANALETARRLDRPG